MVPKNERLTRVSFSHYFKLGKRNHFPHLTILTASSDRRQIAVVVGKKVSKSAVRRNTLRRRIVAVVQTELQSVQYTGVLIIIVKPSFAALSRKAAQDCTRTSIAEILKSA